ncbi:hypothetical protein [Cellulosimicrobium sp. Marseille-Q4280]|uniref:hypothetical protein n=1 Tax=Cellulosimicrobium sp. Marseille-Q4280 TaxID=2937992 RepID=UPI002040949E|nr:hypothetical protein [Cellulosimicrobium sp. Marseille-Q4280]
MTPAPFGSGEAAPRPAGTRVTGDDVRTAATWLTGRLERHEGAAFDAQAGPVRWSCWTTAEHVVDDLVAYALQLAALPRLAYVPLVGPRGEDEIVHVDRETGTAGLVEALLGGAELLATLVETRPGDARAYHPYGLSDPEGFAAMGVVEVLVHGHDLLLGLTGEDVPFPAGVAPRVLARLFPDVTVQAGEDPDLVLLWATGRGELAGRARRTRWRWDSTVR